MNNIEYEVYKIKNPDTDIVEENVVAAFKNLEDARKYISERAAKEYILVDKETEEKYVANCGRISPV